MGLSTIKKVDVGDKISAKVAKQLHTLPWDNNEHACGDEKYLVFTDCEDKLVGVSLIRFLDKQTLYIGKFEVKRKYRGFGCGREMFDWITTNYSTKRVMLTHMDPTDDDGASYEFWKHIGFEIVDQVKHRMVKKIK